MQLRASRARGPFAAGGLRRESGMMELKVNAREGHPAAEGLARERDISQVEGLRHESGLM